MSTPGFDFLYSIYLLLIKKLPPVLSRHHLPVRSADHHTMTDKEISNLLGPTFKVNVYDSKNAAFRLLKDNINRRVPESSARNHWRAAWRRFENTSNQYLPKQETIRIDDKNPELSRLKYTTNYRRQAVIRFLPYVEEKLPLVRGRAKKDLLIPEWCLDIREINSRIYEMSHL